MSQDYEMNMALKYRVRRWAFVALLIVGYVWAENVPL
jgi:hypothetical protein